MAKWDKKDKKEDTSSEMSLSEARAWRASLYTEQKSEKTVQENRESFRIFWIQNRKQYNAPKELEEIVWKHLVSMKMDTEEKFEEGLSHFGLKKV